MTPNHPSRLRRFVLLAVTKLIFAASTAFPAEAPATGAIAGRVANAKTGAFLAGAEVAVEQGATAMTDRNGTFLIEGVGQIGRAHV